MRGHAIECRLNAENPYRDFLPGPGLVTVLRPPGGPFVRLDAGVVEGKAVGGNYDSMFGKLIAWGPDRDAARRRMLRGLDEMVVEGIPTTIPFHQWVLDQAEFIDATATTNWVEQALGEGRFDTGGEMVGPAPAAAAKPVRLVVEVGGRRVPVSLWGEGMPVAPTPPEALHGHGHGGVGGTIVAPMQGTIKKVMVESGQEIEAGQDLCILEAMKMENRISSPRDGIVSEVFVKADDVVQTDQALMVIE
jgi:acetyl-CoA/propionyl-CoA carboxylase biotin carboxyl carrier protein